MTVVYVAGPYRSDPVAGTRAAIEAGIGLWRDSDGGVTPHIPHLTFLADLVCPMPRVEWLALDLGHLERCDAVLRLPGQSVGADIEVERAHALGIPVFTDPAYLLAWAAKRTEDVS
jgi:hypothetical protein